MTYMVGGIVTGRVYEVGRVSCMSHLMKDYSMFDRDTGIPRVSPLGSGFQPVHFFTYTYNTLKIPLPELYLCEEILHIPSYRRKYCQVFL
jgi:hypothetical protein